MEKVNFGFKKVDFSEKKKLVKEVFSNVAKKYDLMNDLMSAGVHRLWKNKLINEIEFNENIEIADLAGGTGDIALRMLKKFDRKNIQNFNIKIVDINQDMLDVGKESFVNLGYYKNYKFVCSDGENLELEDNQYDFVTISFGIRNYTNIKKGIEEIYRILKPGGKFICLEFSKVRNAMLNDLYDLYSFNLIPKIGKIILNDEESYQYLVESIRKFPTQEDFKLMIEEAGFKDVIYKNLSGGVVAIHTGYKR